MRITAWRKSSYSHGAESACIEVGVAPGRVGVRDTKDRDRGYLEVSRTTWKAFVQRVAR